MRSPIFHSAISQQRLKGAFLKALGDAIIVYFFRPNAGRRYSDRATCSTSSPINPQWKVELPQNPAARNHGKFVPMQFRTQPANLPGGMHRQATSLQFHDKGKIHNISLNFFCTNFV